MSVKYRITKRGYVVFSLTGVIVLSLFILGVMKMNVASQTSVKTNDTIQQSTEQSLVQESSTSQAQTQTKDEASATSQVTGQTESTVPPEVGQTVTTQKESETVSLETREADLKKTSARVYFEPNKFILESIYYGQLDHIIVIANKYKDAKIVVEGNYNGYPAKKVSKFWLKLSNDRAEVVMAYLVGKGLSPERITIVNNGCNKMINRDDSMEEIKKNRRVDVFLK